MSEKDYLVEEEVVEQPFDDEEAASEEASRSLPEKPVGEVVEQVYSTGKRKTAIARVWLRRGKGRFSINKLTLDDYFNRETQRMIVKQPMRLTKNLNDFDVIATVEGGGKSSQADAVKHGIAKALALFNAEENRSVLKKAGFLTRDSRMKERKKYGLRGARARFQFSKR
ncbi:MAG: 30S ribosomal protein S9 [bacterium]|nr:30S ribosomal protein S9 [bacterium]